MRLKFLFAFLVVASAVLLISCNGRDHIKAAKPSSGPETTYADGARRVTIDELQAMIDSGEAYILDVRDQASYDAGHIPGSRLMLAGDVVNHINELPRDKTIITYCA
jgi:3-mercaptopyruvate sulfurtransferase SseA